MTLFGWYEITWNFIDGSQIPRKGSRLDGRRAICVMKTPRSGYF